MRDKNKKLLRMREKIIHQDISETKEHAMMDQLHDLKKKMDVLCSRSVYFLLFSQIFQIFGGLVLGCIEVEFCK